MTLYFIGSGKFLAIIIPPFSFWDSNYTCIRTLHCISCLLILTCSFPVFCAPFWIFSFDLIFLVTDYLLTCTSYAVKSIHGVLILVITLFSTRIVFFFAMKFLVLSSTSLSIIKQLFLSQCLTAPLFGHPVYLSVFCFSWFLFLFFFFFSNPYTQQGLKLPMRSRAACSPD